MAKIVGQEDDVKAVDPAEPVTEMVKKAGVEMPDMVATGDLTVDKNKDVKKINIKDIPLPEKGSKFMLDGHEYKVVYINPGQHRFSCEPCKGVY